MKKILFLLPICFVANAHAARTMDLSCHDGAWTVRAVVHEDRAVVDIKTAENAKDIWTEKNNKPKVGLAAGLNSKWNDSMIINQNGIELNEYDVQRLEGEYEEIKITGIINEGQPLQLAIYQSAPDWEEQVYLYIQKGVGYICNPVK